MPNDRESIQTRLLSNIDDTYNKNEGEFFYDALKPVAIEAENIYIVADGILDKTFADTATAKDLDNVVKEVGIYRKLTTKSFNIVTITGTVGAIIKKGEKVSSDSINFVFTEDSIMPISKTIDVPVICEKYGVIGNVPIGAIKYFPKTLEGLQTVTNSQAFTNGYDEETDDNLRERYYTKVQTPATSGNKYHYRNWSLEITGVGDTRVVPLWNGAGTVKVILINANKLGVDPTLVSSVKTYIDPIDGMGEGQAPIGATCTVVSAIELEINITVILTIDPLNVTLSQVIANIESSITEYLASIAFKQNYISFAKIGAIILNTTGVIDYINLKVNGGVSNIDILDTEVAVLGGVIVG